MPRTLLYVTCRAARDGREWRFLNKLDALQRLHCGVIKVSTEHLQPGATTGLWQPEFSQDNMTLEQLVDAAYPAKPLLYVHGHRTEFRKAIEQAILLQDICGHQGTMLVFSWPTGMHEWDQLSAYRRSRSNLDPAATHLADLIRRLYNKVCPHACTALPQAW